MTIGGTVCIRNGESLDYCWKEAIKSLLPVCHEVVVCEGQSTDNTREILNEWAQSEPKIKVCEYAWPHPKGDIDFWVNWIQYARVHLKTDYHIQLDADEILDEESYPLIRDFVLRKRWRSLICDRLNFWKDHKHLIPHGECLGHRVVRIAPQDVWLASDGSHHKGAEAAAMAEPSNVRIFHYGFLRKRDAYFDKSRQLHTMFFGGMTDQRMIDAEKADGNWMEKIEDVPWTKRLIPYRGRHPAIAIPWLKERGYA